MLNKTFDELRRIDISKHIKQRDGFDYLNWAKCIELLHENGAETVYFTPLTNKDGSSLFMSELAFAKDEKASPNRCYEVAIEIVIDDKKFIMRAPVMNGSNPVRDNSMSQQRVWNAQTRAFVKGVAIHTGLGFDLWCRAEQNEEDNAPKEEDLSIHNLFKIKERVTKDYTRVIKKIKNTKEVAEKLGMTEDEVKAYFTYYDMLARFEQNLSAL